MRVFTTEDLCRTVYQHLPEIKKKHRVSLIRAARRVLQREPNWRMVRTQFRGAPLIFFNAACAKPDLKNFLAGHPTTNRERDISRYSKSRSQQ